MFCWLTISSLIVVPEVSVPPVMVSTAAPTLGVTRMPPPVITRLEPIVTVEALAALR